MPTTKPKRKSNRELTVTTGWARGQKVKFLGFAEGQRGIAFTHVGPTTTVVTGTPGLGDALVELDGEALACWFRNLNPFPAHVVVVHADRCGLSFAELDNVDELEKSADLGLKFLPQDHKRTCTRLKRLVAKYGEFTWVHYGLRAPVLVVGVVPRK